MIRIRLGRPRIKASYFLGIWTHSRLLSKKLAPLSPRLSVDVTIGALLCTALYIGVVWVRGRGQVGTCPLDVLDPKMMSVQPRLNAEEKEQKAGPFPTPGIFLRLNLNTSRKSSWALWIFLGSWPVPFTDCMGTHSGPWTCHFYCYLELVSMPKPEHLI